MLENLIAGLLAMLTFKNIIIMVIGVGLGIVFGSIPGLTATMAIAIALPITFTMEPGSAMALLISLYIGGVSGGMIPAILLKLPGTPSSIATTFDGYPMAQKGYAEKAFSYSIIFSILGGILSVALLILIAPSLAIVAIKFGPKEYFAIVIFALTLVSSLSEGSLLKALLSALLGIGFSLVGSAPIDAVKRFTFDYSQLNAGFQLLAVLIGLFAISEILQISEKKIKPLPKGDKSSEVKKIGLSFKEVFKQKWNFLRSALLGVGIGILPGVGGGTANILAYVTAKNQSKTPEKFGEGFEDGIVASEAANNASVGGALIPLMALGIPGETATAMLLGGLILHGIQPGPLFFISHIDIVYGIFGALIIAHIFLIIYLFYSVRIFIRLLKIPGNILLPIIIVLCAVGAFAENNRVFDIAVLVFCGILGYIFLRLKVPLMPFILGFILGPLAESNLRKGLMATQGDFMPFLTSPIPLVFWLITLISLGFSAWKYYKDRSVLS